MPARPTNIRWLLIFLLFVLSAVAFLDRVNMSVAGPRIIAAYHLTDVQFGLLSTAFLLGYAFLQTPAGWLSDRWGPRRVLAIGVIWWGAFTAITAMIPIAIAPEKPSCIPAPANSSRAGFPRKNAAWPTA
jgi:ACS family glucarate transporter-like MFS transporter